MCASGVCAVCKVTCTQDGLRGNVEYPYHKADYLIEEAAGGQEHTQHDKAVAEEEQGEPDGEQEGGAGALLAVVDPAIEEVQNELGHGEAGNEIAKLIQTDEIHGRKQCDVEQDSDGDAELGGGKVDGIDHLYDAKDKEAYDVCGVGGKEGDHIRIRKVLQKHQKDVCEERCQDGKRNPRKCQGFAGALDAREQNEHKYGVYQDRAEHQIGVCDRARIDRLHELEGNEHQELDRQKADQKQGIDDFATGFLHKDSFNKDDR